MLCNFFKSEHSTFYVMHVFKVKSFISDDLMYSNDTIYESIVNEPKEKLNHLVARLKRRIIIATIRLKL